MITTEKLEIAKRLQGHHYIFRAFWDIGNVVIGDFEECQTAAIAFDAEGGALRLIINREFWDSLNMETKVFLICHEMFHVILHHGRRFVEYFGTANEKNMNIAADVVINEMLVGSLGFVRKDLDSRLAEHGCWFDTIFKDRRDVARDECTEYYFNILKEMEVDTEDLFSIDDHVTIAEDDPEMMDQVVEDAGIYDHMDNSLLGNIPMGDQEYIKSIGGGGTWHSVKLTHQKVRKKWESVIKRWELMHRKEDFLMNERWDRISPRYSQVIRNGIHLPTECHSMDLHKVQNRIEVFFFLDTSGSCIELKDRFFSAARSLDKKKFNVRLFCFDTTVVETDLQSLKIHGGGGTLFNIIEQKIQQIVKAEHVKYPGAVFLITDGMGDYVFPERPERWHWFLSSDYTHYVPQGSRHYRLADYY